MLFLFANGTSNLMSAAVIIISICILSFCFLAYSEVKRSNKNRLWLRISFTAFAIASLACITFDINVRTHAATVKTNEAVLLTDNYNKDSVANFLAAREGIAVYNTARIDTITAKNFAAVYMFGNGLNNQQLPELKNVPLVFYPAVTNGIVTVNWQQHIKGGEQLQVQGKYYNSLNTPVKLILNGLHSNLDSVTIPANNIFQFSLSCLPKHKAEAIYQLFVLNKKDTLEINPLPVEVTDAKPVRVLLLSSSPDFENKFLKNWLTPNGYAVADYAATSKNKNTESFINFKSASLNNITTSSFDSFDVAITDATFITGLGKQQQDAIHSQVENGLGLIIRTDSTASSSAFMNNIKVSAAQRRQQAVKFYLNNIGKDSFALPDGQISFLKNISNAQTLISDASDNVAAASYITGKGTIIITSLANTLQFALAGRKDEYSRLWSYLLQQAVKEKLQPESIAISELPRINKPVEISVRSVGDNFKLTVDTRSVYLKQDALLPFIKQGTYWPTYTGWHMINRINQFNWYVFDSTDYKNVAAFEKINATKQFIKQQQVQLTNKVVQTTINKPIPKIWFVMIFILSCTYLWIERKLVKRL